LQIFIHGCHFNPQRLLIPGRLSTKNYSKSLHLRHDFPKNSFIDYIVVVYCHYFEFQSTLIAESSLLNKIVLRLSANSQTVLCSLGSFHLPWFQRFFLIFLRMRQLQESREAANTSHEKPPGPGYLLSILTERMYKINLNFKLIVQHRLWSNELEIVPCHTL